VPPVRSDTLTASQPFERLRRLGSVGVQSASVPAVVERGDLRLDVEAHDAFDQFARARTAGLLRFAHVLTGDRDRAADLVQDALERAALAWPRIINRDDPEAYVRRIMVNRHVSIWRRTRRERLVAETPDVAYNPPDPHDARLWAELGKLPARQRAVLVLRFYEDLGAAETAAVLGCSVGTVKSTTSRGLARLRASLDSSEGEGTWNS
jgi:RNA polymerase sigma-70 factor (sigma-E family)